MSKAQQIALALTALVQGVTPANGFVTNVGREVFRGRQTIDESELPCTVIVEGDDTLVSGTKQNIQIRQRYVLEGHHECDPLQPNDKAHEIIADLKRVVFGRDDENLGGLVRKIEYVGRNIALRQNGTRFVSASIEIDVEFVENLTNP